MPSANIQLNFGECNGTAGFKINDLTIQPNQYTAGIHEINFDYDYGSDIAFTMFGKGRRDTVVENDKILKDKFVIIELLQLEFAQLENWQFQTFIWDPFFAFNGQTKHISIPQREDFPIWYMQVTQGA